MVRDSCCVEAVKHPVARRPNHSGKSSEPGRGDRLSSPEPKVLIAMMKEACEQSARFHESLGGGFLPPVTEPDGVSRVPSIWLEF